MDIGSRVRLAASTLSLAAEVTGPSVREDASFEAFMESMPSAYRNLFDEASMRAHAAIAGRRTQRAARVEAWKLLPDGVVAICVVADDVAGLSSRVCAAVFAHDAQVVGAQVYRRAGSRHTPALSPSESIGLFWIRRPASGSNGPVSARDLARIGRTLQPLLRDTDGLLLASRLSRGVHTTRRGRGHVGVA